MGEQDPLLGIRSVRSSDPLLTNSNCSGPVSGSPGRSSGDEERARFRGYDRETKPRLSVSKAKSMSEARKGQFRSCDRVLIADSHRPVCEGPTKQAVMERECLSL